MIVQAHHELSWQFDFVDHSARGGQSSMTVIAALCSHLLICKSSRLNLGQLPQGECMYVLPQGEDGKNDESATAISSD